MRKPLLETALRLYEEAGARDVEHWRTGKHYRVRGVINEIPVTTTVPGSPSDHRAALNNEHQIKRALREAMLK